MPLFLNIFNRQNPQLDFSNPIFLKCKKMQFQPLLRAFLLTFSSKMQKNAHFCDFSKNTLNPCQINTYVILDDIFPLTRCPKSKILRSFSEGGSPHHLPEPIGQINQLNKANTPLGVAFYPILLFFLASKTPFSYTSYR